MSEEQGSLFGDLDKFTDWHKEWQDMPEFSQEDLKPFQSVIVHFETKEDRQAFEELLAQQLTDSTKYIWYPEVEVGKFKNYRYVQEEKKDAQKT